MSTARKDPRWREAEQLAQRHARLVLGRLDAHVVDAPEEDHLDLVGRDLAILVEHYRSRVPRERVERLHDLAAGRTAVCYARAGYSKTAVLWADEHRVALFGYTDVGHVAPLNACARDLVLRALDEQEHHVRTAADVMTRHRRAVREAAERTEREAHAAALRAQEQRDAARRAQRRRREVDEATLSRSLALLLELRIDPTALHTTVQRLSLSGVVAAVAASADRLGLTERPHAIALLRSMLDEAAGALEVATPEPARGSTPYRSARIALYRAHDELDAAAGVDVPGHVAPDEVAARLREVERCWRAVVAELVRVQTVSLVPTARTGRSAGPVTAGSSDVPLPSPRHAALR